MILSKIARNLSNEPASPEPIVDSSKELKQDSILTSSSEESSQQALLEASERKLLNKRLIELVSGGTGSLGLTEYIGRYSDKLDINYMGDMGRRSLEIAFRRNNSKIAAILVKNGAKIVDHKMEEEIEFFVNRYKSDSLTAVFKGLQEQKEQEVQSTSFAPRMC